MYYASDAAINEKSDFVAIDENFEENISGSVESQKKPLYNLWYEISAEYDIRSGDMDKKMETSLKGRWDEDVIILSSFLLYDMWNQRTSLLVSL